MERNNNNLGEWHLDKRVSISTLVAIAVQLVLLVMFATSMDFRISALENQNVTDARMTRLEQSMLAIDRNLERLEQRTVVALEDIRERLERIDHRLNGTRVP